MVANLLKIFVCSVITEQKKQKLLMEVFLGRTWGEYILLLCDEREVKGIDHKLFNSIEKATALISGVELSSNDKYRKALADTEIQIKKTKSIFFALAGIIFLSLLTTSITFYTASQFYKTSLLSKEEMRQKVWMIFRQ